MEETRIVNGYTFYLDSENNSYECQGDVHYDDEHDEMPESELWSAAFHLIQELKSEGMTAERDHHEKGWVEVSVIN